MRMKKKFEKNNFVYPEQTVGMERIVPRRVVPLLRMSTRVPGGNGLGMGSVLFRRRPQVGPPSYRSLEGQIVAGSRDLSSLKA